MERHIILQIQEYAAPTAVLNPSLRALQLCRAYGAEIQNILDFQGER
jgi:hypothetical protein